MAKYNLRRFLRGCMCIYLSWCGISDRKLAMAIPIKHLIQHLYRLTFRTCSEMHILKVLFIFNSYDSFKIEKWIPPLETFETFQSILIYRWFLQELQTRLLSNDGLIKMHHFQKWVWIDFNWFAFIEFAANIWISFYFDRKFSKMWNFIFSYKPHWWTELNGQSCMESFNVQNARECALRSQTTTNILVLEHGTSLHAKC